MVRSRASLLLEFGQLLNFVFPSKGGDGSSLWKEPPVENALQSFCRDALAVLPRSELREHAMRTWLEKRDSRARSGVAESLTELLDSQLPLKSR